MMKPKEVIDRAYSNVPKEVGSLYDWDWIPSGRGIKFYYLKLVRFFTR